MNNEIDPHDSMHLLLVNQQQIHENIKFADQKALALIGIDAALLGVIYPLLTRSRCPMLVVGFAVCALLAAGIAFAVWVIKPRGERNRARGPGVVDSTRVSLYSERQFLERLRSISAADLLEEARIFIYDRSYIDSRKYTHLRTSLSVSAAGWLGALALAAWHIVDA
jgi:Family of unknown function (DUF5706)